MPMTAEEFKAAWDAAPDAEFAALFLDRDCPVHVERALDRAWRFGGVTHGASLYYLVPCSCNRSAVKWAGGLEAPTPYSSPAVNCWSIKTCARLLDVEQFYVGVCQKCGVVWWLKGEA